jgi:hypothetical protein
LFLAYRCGPRNSAESAKRAARKRTPLGMTPFFGWRSA